MEVISEFRGSHHFIDEEKKRVFTLSFPTDASLQEKLYMLNEMKKIILEEIEKRAKEQFDKCKCGECKKENCSCSCHEKLAL